MKTNENTMSFSEHYFKDFPLTCLASSSKKHSEKIFRWWTMNVENVLGFCGSVMKVDWPCIRIIDLAFRSFSLKEWRWRWRSARISSGDLPLIERTNPNSDFDSEEERRERRIEGNKIADGRLTILHTFCVHLKWRRLEKCRLPFFFALFFFSFFATIII